MDKIRLKKGWFIQILSYKWAEKQQPMFMRPVGPESISGKFIINTYQLKNPIP